MYIEDLLSQQQAENKNKWYSSPIEALMGAIVRNKESGGGGLSCIMVTVSKEEMAAIIEEIENKPSWHTLTHEEIKDDEYSGYIFEDTGANEAKFIVITDAQELQILRSDAEEKNNQPDLQGAIREASNYKILGSGHTVIILTTDPPDQGQLLDSNQPFFNSISPENVFWELQKINDQYFITSTQTDYRARSGHKGIYGEDQ